MKRKVGCQHGDARSLLMAFRHQVGNLPPDWDACNKKLVAASIVGLQQHADRKPLPGYFNDAGGGADASLKVEELGASAGADAAFGNGAVLGGIERGVDVFALDP